MPVNLDKHIHYPLTQPKMNAAVPPNQVPPGMFGRLVGVDGRYNGCLHKFYGMEEVLDLDDITGMGDIDANDGPSFIQPVTFQKRGTSDVYRGFVIRWDRQDDNTEEQIDLIYTLNNGTSWTKHCIWAARTLAFTSGGTGTIAAGDTIVGATDGAEAVVDSVILSSGAWGSGTAVGILNIYNKTGTFKAAGEDLNVDGGQANIATIAAASVDNGITSTLDIDCAVDGAYLYVAVEGKACKTVYYASAALAVVDSGPGAYAAELAVLTNPDTTAQDSSYNLRGNGTFQIAWRFYDSTRGIYSALSVPLTITLDVMKTTKAIGTITFNSGGGDNGLMVSGDYFTINSKKYEYISDNSADVVIAAAAGATIAQHVTALTDAINGYSATGGVSAKAQTSSVLIEATARGSGGNAYTLAKVETGGNTTDISVSGATFSGGGEETTEPEEHCKATLNFPADDAVISGTSTFAGFDALFDKVDVFRTIDLGGSAAAQGAVFYLEQTLAMPANETPWDAPLTVTIGTKLDDALPFLTTYDPEKDVVQAPPQSGSIGRYQGITFMGQVAGANQGDTLHSSLEHVSGEYFSTYNRRRGDAEEGRPMRYIPAGDSLMILEPNAVVHVFKSTDMMPLQFTVLHRNRGLSGKRAAHAVGNSIIMITGTGLVLLSSTNGSMGEISAAGRVLLGTWQADLADIDSAYDSLMNASFFLNPTDSEMLIVWHSTQTVTMLEGANFVACGSTPDIATGLKTRAYFVTTTGLIVMPDNEESENGNMWDLSSSYTLDGTADAASAGKNKIYDADATFHADMVGASIYMTSGDNAGQAREITAYTPVAGEVPQYLTTATFGSAIAVGDRYSIAPVPFSARLWPLQVAGVVSRFNRWVLTGLTMKVRALSGFTSNDNDKWRLGAFRNSGTTIDSGTAEADVDGNPTDSAGALGVDGIDVEPYIEQIAVGVKFELTDVEAGVSSTDSRDVTA